MRVCFNDSADGVSMPRNTVVKPASTIDSTRTGSEARSTLASVYSSNGRPCSFCQRATSGNSFAASRRLPMKLSSTTKIDPRQPSSYSTSSSRSICFGAFTRGLRPYSSMMSQNSHWNGQPREHCTLIEV